MLEFVWPVVGTQQELFYPRLRARRHRALERTRLSCWEVQPQPPPPPPPPQQQQQQQ
jgi:hypothetical protein